MPDAIDYFARKLARQMILTAMQCETLPEEQKNGAIIALEELAARMGTYLDWYELREKYINSVSRKIANADS